MGDAFRVAGRARGERHPHDLVGAQGLRHERRERVAPEIIASRETVSGGPRRRGRRPCRSGEVDGAPGSSGRIGKPLNVTGHTKARLPRSAGCTRPHGRGSRADLVGDRSNALAGEEDVGELSPVGELDGDHIPGADTKVLERGRRALDPRAEIPIRHALAVINEGLPVWMGRARCCKIW